MIRASLLLLLVSATVGCSSTAPPRVEAGHRTFRVATVPRQVADEVGTEVDTGIGTEDDPVQIDEANAASKGEEGAAGSNPLASVSKIDFIWQYKKGRSSAETHDYQFKASTMLHPRLKLNIEGHYLRTDRTGSNERAWESFSLKPIYFVTDVEVNETWGMRVAAGLEYIRDFGHRDKGIGTGSDQLAPLFGLAFMNRETRMVLIPLIQHFENIGGGPDISQTALRLIALQPLEGGRWIKGDLKVPRDWENNAWPANLEVEFGKMVNSTTGVFVQGLGGLGGDRPLDWGGALGLRLNF